MQIKTQGKSVLLRFRLLNLSTNLLFALHLDCLEKKKKNIK